MMMDLEAMDTALKKTCFGGLMTAIFSRLSYPDTSNSREIALKAIMDSFLTYDYAKSQPFERALTGAIETALIDSQSDQPRVSVTETQKVCLYTVLINLEADALKVLIYRLGYYLKYDHIATSIHKSNSTVSRLFTTAVSEVSRSLQRVMNGEYLDTLMRVH